jgi:thiol-disulfide isomerase/thioredoxin
MARTPSTMLPLGTALPYFRLPDFEGSFFSAQDFSGRPLLVMFLCNHCPFVKHVREELALLGRVTQARGVGVVAINSNDFIAYPADSPELMREESREAGYTFPYLVDESQEVARAFAAACTPDFYLFDAGGKLVYRGQLDESRPGNGVPVTGRDLRLALDCLLAGSPVPEKQSPSLGCNIKWK